MSWGFSKVVILYVYTCVGCKIDLVEKGHVHFKVDIGSYFIFLFAQHESLIRLFILFALLKIFALSFVWVSLL
jgi:hypothetical protein